MRKVLLTAVSIVATASTTQAGPIRDWIKARREAKQAPCQTCQVQRPQPMVARPVLPAVAQLQSVQTIRNAFGCPGGICYGAPR